MPTVDELGSVPDHWGKRDNDFDVDDVVALFEQFDSLKRVAEELGVSRQSDQLKRVVREAQRNGELDRDKYVFRRGSK